MARHKEALHWMKSSWPTEKTELSKKPCPQVWHHRPHHRSHLANSTVWSWGGSNNIPLKEVSTPWVTQRRPFLIMPLAGLEHKQGYQGEGGDQMDAGLQYLQQPESTKWAQVFRPSPYGLKLKVHPPLALFWCLGPFENLSMYTNLN